MFKVIPDTDGNYSCDTEGNIKSNARIVDNPSVGQYYLKERILKPYLNNKGYKVVDLRINNKTRKCLVHRLVATTWLDNPNNYPIINHKDNNPLNNNVDNLEWCNYSYNINYCIKQGRHNMFSEKRMKSMHSRKTYLWKPVCKYDMNGNFICSYNSLADAAESITTSPSKSKVTNISSCCKGKAKSAYGYIWRYKHDENVTTNDG